MTAYTFTESQKTDIRRFMGYPPKGIDSHAIIYGHLTNASGNLEHRLDRCTEEEGAIVVGLLETLAELDAAVLASADNLDADKIAVIERNRTEVADRAALFTHYRHRLCDFLGLPPGPHLKSGGRWKRMVV